MTLPNSPLQTTSDKPLYLGMELRGYRSWVTDTDDFGRPVLRPVHRGRLTPWERGVNVASCYSSQSGPGVDLPTSNHSDEPVPYRECGCGFWAYLTPYGYDRHHLIRDMYASSLVTGVVRGTGNIVESVNGFRAEKAEIVALAPAYATQPLLESYGSYETSGHGIGLLDFYRLQMEHSGHCPCLWCKAKRGRPAPSLAALAMAYQVPYYSTYDEMCTAWPPTHEMTSGGPAVVPVSMSAMQLLSHPMVTQLLTTMRARRTVAGWPPQPVLTGTMSQVLDGWWRWALTKNTSSSSV